jgi:hypothetical protein
MTGWQPTCAAAALGGRNQAAQADGASRRSLASSRIFASWWRRRPASVFRKGNFTPISWAPCRRLGAARREGVPRSGAASARHRGVRGRHPDRVGEAPDPGSRSGVRAPRPCRWSSDRSGPATTRSVGAGRRSRPGRPRLALVVTACTTPPHPHPQQSASAGVPSQSGSGNRASVVEPAGRIRRVRPDPAGLAGAAAGVQGPPHRAGRALGGRAAARAGLAKRPGDKTTRDDSRRQNRCSIRLAGAAE